MATGGNVQSIKALFADVEQFDIPDFQRNYAWENKEIDDFLTDVNSATRLGKQHFIGALILLSKSAPDDRKKCYEVIDGQQRLTTLFMYLAVLRDAAVEQGDIRIDPLVEGGQPIDVMSKIGDLIFSDPGIGKPRFRSNRLLRTMFQERIIAHPSAGRPEMPKRDKESTLALRKAYWRLQGRVKSDLEQFATPAERLAQIYKIFDTVAASFNLLCIYTGTYSEAFDIFMTLNNRGRALGPADLVKTLLMKYLTDNESDADLLRITEKIAVDWEQISDNLEQGDIDQFLRHFMLSIQDLAVQSKSIYSSVDKFINNDEDGQLGNAEIKTRASDMLISLQKASQVYKKLLQPNLVADSKARRSCQSMLQVLDSYRILMMLILAEDSALTVSQQREVARLAEVLSLRWVLVGGNAQELEDHFQEVCGILRDADKSYEDVKDHLVTKIPSNERVTRAFKDSASADLARAVYYGINIQLGDPAALIQYEPARLQVEHIAPATATNSWISVLFGSNHNADDDTPTEYSSVVEAWGNKTLLESDINNDVKQKLFAAKRDGDPDNDWLGYKNSVLAVTKDLQNLTQWGQQEIDRRGDWVADCFLKIWDVSQNLQGVQDFSDWLLEDGKESD